MPFFDPTQESAVALIERAIAGPITMVNLLKFRELADYSQHPELDPGVPISGAEAYRPYSEHTMPFLLESGGEVVFEGAGGSFFIGPLEKVKTGAASAH